MDKLEQKFYVMKMDYTNNISEKPKKEKRDKIYGEYLGLKTGKRQIIREIIYPVLRDYMPERLFDSDFYGVIDAFNEIKNTTRYQDEPVANKEIAENILLKAYLYLCLESGGSDSSLFSEATTLLTLVKSLLNQTSEFSEEQYTNEIKIFEENKAIYDSMITNDFWTEVNLVLPFPLGISEEIMKLTVSGVEVQLKTEKFQFDSPFFDVESGVQQLAFDRYGLLTRTKVRLAIKKYFPEKQEKLYFFGENETKSTILTSSIKYLNEIISRYRLVENNYWIENVDSRMIDITSIKFIASGATVKNIVAQSNSTYYIRPEYDYNQPVENKRLVNLLEMSKNDLLWQELLADAKSFLLVSKLREAVISLNSSFENLFYTRFKDTLSNYEGDEKIQAFFDGDISYETSGTSDLLDEETFNKLKSAGAFPNGVPSVYKVIKRYYKVVPEDQRVPYSKTQLQKAINKIRKYRNDIVHGNLHVELTDKHVYEAIEEFIELSTEIEKYHNG